MEWLYVDQTIRGSKPVKNGQVLLLKLLGIPSYICLDCKREGRNSYIISEDIERRMNQHILSKLVPLLEKGFKFIELPLPKVTFDFHQKEKEDKNSEDSKSAEEDPENSNKEMLIPYHPIRSLKDVILPQGTKRKIMSTLSLLKNRKMIFEDWELRKMYPNGVCVSVNLSGPSGTGKTITAEAIANELSKQLVVVNYAHLESKYVGETPKNIKKAFKIASDTGAILFFDEADSFLSKRLTNISQSADYAVNISRSMMLMELDHFDGIVIFATNLIENYDPAFQRRILSHIKYDLPDEECREALWKIHLSDKVPLCNDVKFNVLAKDVCKGFTGADIKNAVLHAAVLAAGEDVGKKCIRLNHFMAGIEHVKQGKFESKIEQGPLEKLIEKPPVENATKKKETSKNT
jgi:SpoVK/Ycf46/Vps4 family AAA+-type ATPase